ncbi:hypothetical protein BC829DRAFT_216993 [Chytridium lagenaria]|nr:hypothetical protein BC829DRAFT_216993 [Chytridium lagenaria]
MNTTLTITIQESANQDDLLCLSSVDLFFGPCLMNEAQLNWRYDNVPTEIIPQKDHYFRLKSGTGQCLQQLTDFRYALFECSNDDQQKYRRELSTSVDGMMTIQNVRYMALIGTVTDSLGRVGLRPTSWGSYLVFEDGLMRDMYPGRRGLWCLTASLIIEPCVRSQNATISWSLDYL